MPARIWTEEVLKNVFALLLDGYSYMEIADLYGVTRTAVRSRVNQTWVGPAYRERKSIAKARATRFWTKERQDEVRRLYWSGKTGREIAKAMDITENAAKRIIGVLGIGDRKAASKRINAARIGTKHTPEALEKMRAKAKARFERPEYRARHFATHTPEVMRQRQREALFARRGFDVPDHLQAQYAHLTTSKKFSAREAGEILGLIPQSTTASKGA